VYVCVSNHISVTLQTSGAGNFRKSYLSNDIDSLLHTHTFLWNKLALKKIMAMVDGETVFTS